MLYLPEANSFHPAKAKVRPFWLAAAMHRRLYLSAGSPVCERDARQTVAKAMRFYKGTCVGEVPVIGTKGDRVATDHVRFRGKSEPLHYEERICFAVSPPRPPHERNCNPTLFA